MTPPALLASTAEALFSPLTPPLPTRPGERLLWGRLQGAATALAIAAAARAHPGLVLALVEDVQAAGRLRDALTFFLGEGSEQGAIPLLGFPDWETLPYDCFSPLPELVSERLLTLHRLPGLKRGVLVVPVATLLQRLPPRDYVDGQSLVLAVGDQLDLDATRRRLERAGYSCVSQVMGHGEFAVRGSILDCFPMGSTEPLRIDLLDDEVDTIRTFDPETQRTRERLTRVRMLPAREFPLSEEAISGFRQRYRVLFEGDPTVSLIYREVSEGRTPGGLEYYLPLFFEETATLFDYLPEGVLALESDRCRDAATAFLDGVEARYEQRRHDVERPLLPPARIYLAADELAHRLKGLSGVLYQRGEQDERRKGYAEAHNFATRALPPMNIQARAAHPAQALQEFLAAPGRRVLFIAEGLGRREMLNDHLHGFGVNPRPVEGWAAFLAGKDPIGLTVAPLEQGLWLADPDLAIVTETQLYGERVRQERRRRARERDGDAIVRNLTELTAGSPVVHEDHGVGRYLGLETLTVGGLTTEFLTLEYAKGDKLYVPVSSLHLISRYTGASPENAPLHRLGGDQWDKVKRKAAEKACDVAAELLDIYARRAARPGIAFPEPGEEYAAFADAFAFEETPDQARAIEGVLADMEDTKPMDRVVCGDVGFGKTEVAMRAAFVAANGGRQVAVLVPTTLLAQQHFENFSDRFADWPIKVESLSRFRNAKEQKVILDGLAKGTLDIVVGTHKLLQASVKFKNLGLVIIDEEHRFGVRHKEQMKSLRAEVDVLTLTATPIPRTLNMAMSGLRDLSIIATPPVERHPIKTFVSPWNDALIQEAVLRELKRGGQVYFLHNEVETIENQAQKLEALIPEARIQVAHGQLRERDLERIMRDFYHQRFNVLVCTTIIESGIDVPSANTIVINRADKLGLAQLHQLRGRVGRSHHRAYAYLITPPPKQMTEDAKKRLEAIESMEDLGAGFTLATHDLEIRGAGELLGDEQSGQIHEIGFSLYMDLLERAVQALKAGRTPELDRPLDHGAEIDLGLPALLPSDYLPDVHTRLVMYKRIASAKDQEALREIQVEMIDRFGLLPDPAKNLMAITEIKLTVQPYGIKKIEAGPAGGRVIFGSDTKVDPTRLIKLIQTRPKEYKLDGGDKLRFFRDLSDPTQRIEQVGRVVEQLLG
ncbi:transcription-repair coupling factor [Candidatus Thiodictyon syntrophicum]|jgi:transcription-repair coupling factor (superfamily II helicase)|uniref:Transcription-repair-coupling factor n=2 Tax=Chromatiaceae TaxID=1046 RepID=A0A2K8U9X9_9GAMM|nr:transcription-repair coupling factor [Candidatus Thiodictyon syntrophicum]AUB82388.1 transcription-repair coupling factor [Candidatus Thiodictyon syntrophicum]